MKQIEVLLPGAVDHGFDYLVPEGMDIRPGDIVSVPLGKKETTGIAWGEGAAKIDPSKLKKISGKTGDAPFLPAMREFIRWTAWYNCAPLGAVLKMTMPLQDADKKVSDKVKAHAVSHFDPAKMSLAPLSDIQKEAADALREHTQDGFSVTLLDGVTGSGKTEVYFDAIARIIPALVAGSGAGTEPDPAIRRGWPQILVLLPEIALSVQWLERFKSRFGFAPAVWNSEVTPARKRAIYQAVISGEARVVIGARSALFLPYANLKLIVADEEHDSSYKQEEGVIYHARDMAVARARIEKIPIVLVSATPSLESYHNARSGKYREVSLSHRHGAAQLPDVEMLDMRTVEIERGCFIANPLRRALAEAIAQGHQAMLFLNRRGYAPLMLCRKCGHRFQCPQCSAWLVVHRSRGEGKLQCHHCDYRMPVPDTCPACAAEGSLHAIGPGVERVHEEAKSFLPQARIAVLASDQAGGFRDLSRTIVAMEKGEVDLLIGTQMVAKGHHFAGLSAVGVVDADLGLAGADLRAAERTYQLLHQLSGRAGREAIRGKVYLQSYLPEHPVMKALLSGDRDTFLAAELAARRDAHMPPFSRLAAVIVEGAKEEQVMRLAKHLAASAPADPRIRILGPAPAPMFLLRGKFRHRLLVRADRNVNLPDYMKGWIGADKAPSSVRVKIDIDPVGFY